MPLRNLLRQGFLLLQELGQGVATSCGNLDFFFFFFQTVIRQVFYDNLLLLLSRCGLLTFGLAHVPGQAYPLSVAHAHAMFTNFMFVIAILFGVSGGATTEAPASHLA